MSKDMNTGDVYENLNCTKTEKQALLLLRSALTGDTPNPDDFADCDWESVFHELKVQTVAGVAADAVVKLEEHIPEDVITSWLMYTSQVVMANCEKILQAQSELTELFEKENIPMAILKGAAAAMNYPNPLQRNMGDVDFLVNRADFDRAYDVMLENGYVEVSKNVYHSEFKKGEYIFELHMEPAGITGGSKGAEIRRLFKTSCKDAVKSGYHGYEFYHLPRLQNGLVLLLHIVHHLGGGLGLRQICDWYCFVKSELTDEVWRDEFQPILKNVGLEHLAIVITEICISCLGANGFSWCRGVKEDVRNELLLYVIKNGNFGRKQTAINKNPKHKKQEIEIGGWASVYKHFKSMGWILWEERWSIKGGVHPIEKLSSAYALLWCLKRKIKNRFKWSDMKHVLLRTKREKKWREKLDVYITTT